VFVSCVSQCFIGDGLLGSSRAIVQLLFLWTEHQTKDKTVKHVIILVVLAHLTTISFYIGMFAVSVYNP